MPALEGMRVLELSQYEAGPSCGQYLAWLGADVVKVESPGGDPGRHVWGTRGISQYYENNNANKRGVAIDMATPEGRNLVLRLIPRFDVLVENHGPGVMERLGLSPDDVASVHPALIYVRIKGYGLSGPYRDYKSFDMLAQAAAGLFSLTGDADGPPVRPGGTFADTGTGVHAALAIVAAYVQRQRTGEGQLIELSMHEVSTMFIRTAGVRSWGRDAPPTERVGDRLGGSPTGMFACKPFGPNDYVYIAINSRRFWEALCKAMGRTDLLTDPRFAGGRDRERNDAELREIVGAWCAQHTKRDAQTILCEAGVSAFAILDTHDVFNDPHLLDRDFVKDVPHPEYGTVTLLEKPWRMEKSDVPLRAAPRLGEHNDQVLAEELDLSSPELAALREQRVIVSDEGAE
jgi:formyl-CoA transferase